MTPTQHGPDGVHPLSPIQHGMLYHHLSGRASDVDLVQTLCTLREELDVDRFEAAWNDVLSRHQPLRTRFRWDGVRAPVQEVMPRVSVKATVLDWRDRAPADREGAFADLLAADRQRGFDIASAPAMRLTLVQWGGGEWRCLWSFHHLLMDGRSIPLVLGDAFTRYDGHRTGGDPALAPQYAAFLEWLERRDASREEGHWRALLDGVTAATPVPGADDELGEGSGGRVELLGHLPPAETAAIASFAKSIGVTTNTVVQGAWALLLSRHAGVDDVVFGATRVCREGTVPDADAIVGLFINTVPVRVRTVAGTPVGDWLRVLRQQHLEVRPFEHTALTDIQRWTGFGAGNPLFESIVVFDRTTLDGWMHADHPGWTQRSFATNRSNQS